MHKNKEIRIVFAIAAVACCAVIIISALSFLPYGEIIYSQHRAPNDPYLVQSESQNGVSVSVDPSFEYQEQASETDTQKPAPEYTVNINTATQYELDALLPGIGESKAAAIVEYREAVGGFRAVSELKEVDGIGEKLYEQIAPYCTVE